MFPLFMFIEHSNGASTTPVARIFVNKIGNKVLFPQHLSVIFLYATLPNVDHPLLTYPFTF